MIAISALLESFSASAKCPVRFYLHCKVLETEIEKKILSVFDFFILFKAFGVIGKKALLTEDPDTEPDRILYSVTSDPRHGYLESTSNEGRLIRSFSQGTTSIAFYRLQQTVRQFVKTLVGFRNEIHRLLFILTKHLYKLQFPIAKKFFIALTLIHFYFELCNFFKCWFRRIMLILTVIINHVVKCFHLIRCFKIKLNLSNLFQKKFSNFYFGSNREFLCNGINVVCSRHQLWNCSLRLV